MDCLADARIGSAAADIGHRFVNLCVAWFARFLNERHGRHNLPRLAISALGNLRIDPSLLDRVERAVGARDALNRGDGFARDVANRNAAGPRYLSVDVDAARAARLNTASKFGARQAQLLTDCPEQRRVGLTLKTDGFAIDLGYYGHVLSPTLAR